MLLVLLRSNYPHQGILPMDPEVILKRFTPATINEPESSIPKQLTEESLWKEIRTVLEGAVKDTSSKGAKSLSVAFHKLQVNQKLNHCIHKLAVVRSHAKDS
jgi:hypothetical protein